MVEQRIEAALRVRERSWAWLGRKIGVQADRMWRLRRGEVSWRHREAEAACVALDMPFAVLFGQGEDVLPSGRERAARRTQAVAS